MDLSLHVLPFLDQDGLLCWLLALPKAVRFWVLKNATGLRKRRIHEMSDMVRWWARIVPILHDHQVFLRLRKVAGSTRFVWSRITCRPPFFRMGMCGHWRALVAHCQNEEKACTHLDISTLQHSHDLVSAVGCWQARMPALHCVFLPTYGRNILAYHNVLPPPRTQVVWMDLSGMSLLHHAMRWQGDQGLVQALQHNAPTLRALQNVVTDTPCDLFALACRYRSAATMKALMPDRQDANFERAMSMAARIVQRFRSDELIAVVAQMGACQTTEAKGVGRPTVASTLLHRPPTVPKLTLRQTDDPSRQRLEAVKAACCVIS